MITARLVIEHHRDRLADERAQAGPDSELMYMVAEAWGLSFARRHVVYNFANDQASATFPLPSHMLAHAVVKRLASRRSASDVQRQAGQQVMGMIAPIEQTPFAMDSASCDGSYCADAEPMFVGALRQLTMGQSVENDDYASHERLSAYHAADGTPIALRKQRTDSTALLLRPVEIYDNVTAPSGTIVDIVGVTETTGQAKLRDNTLLNTYQTTEQTLLSPLRISPWVHQDPLDRALFGIEAPSDRPYVDLDRAREVAGVALSDFHDAAIQIMDLCGALR